MAFLYAGNRFAGQELRTGKVFLPRDWIGFPLLDAD